MAVGGWGGLVSGVDGGWGRYLGKKGLHGERCGREWRESGCAGQRSQSRIRGAFLSSLPGGQELRILAAPLPRFTQFIHLGRVGVGEFSRGSPAAETSAPRPVPGCHLPWLSSSRSPIVSAPRRCGAGGLGRSSLFSSSLGGSRLRKTPSPGGVGRNGGGRPLAFPEAGGRRSLGREPQEGRMGERGS